jgi:hypothetical protein
LLDPKSQTIAPGGPCTWNVTGSNSLKLFEVSQIWNGGSPGGALKTVASKCSDSASLADINDESRGTPEIRISAAKAVEMMTVSQTGVGRPEVVRFMG